MSSSNSAEAPTGNDIVFSGKDGKECEDFIAAIRELAYAQGKEKDHDWMLRLATTRLRSKAIRWHAQLDTNSRNDWELFVKGLLDEYPSVEAPDEEENAIPSSNIPTVTVPKGRRLNAPRYDASSTGRQIGLLRIVSEEGTSLPEYVWSGDPSEMAKSGWNATYESKSTTNRHEALIVSFIPSSKPHQISYLNPRAKLKYLVVSWSTSAQSYDLKVAQSPGITDLSRYSSGDTSKIWNVLDGGYLQASLTHSRGYYETIKFTTTEVHLNTAGESIRFVKPETPLPQDKPQSDDVHPFTKARIVFEPL